MRAANISWRKATKATARLRFFHPEHALILNIEEEHLDFYADLAAIEAVFAQLLEQTSGNGFLLRRRCERDAALCDRARVRSRSVSPRRRDYRGTDIELQDFASVFCVYRRGEKLGEAVLNVPGQHNVSNALGVIALATELGIPFEKIAASLAQVSSTPGGVSRSNTRAIAFCWWTITRIIRPKFARRSQTAQVDRAQTRSDDVSAASLFAHQGAAQRIWRALSTTPTASS